MGSLHPTQRFAQVRYGTPDLGLDPEKRAFFSLPGTSEVVINRVELHDMRTSPEIVPGAPGLDTQGFTIIKHKSALSNGPGLWIEGDNVEKTYFPEVEAMLLDLLPGAKKAVVVNSVVRMKRDQNKEDPKWFAERGGDHDKMVAQRLPRDRAFDFLVAGKTANTAREPLRPTHIDYTIQGLRDMTRWCRKDIKAAAQLALDAEDAQAADVPRYAAFTVWRPLKTVKRDPLAVCDWRTLDPADLCSVAFRQTSEVTESGEFLVHTFVGMPPKQKEGQQWYWLPEQHDDEVLVVKLADTACDHHPDIAVGGLHAGVHLEGSEDEEEPRESIEVRFFVFW